MNPKISANIGSSVNVHSTIVLPPDLARRLAETRVEDRVGRLLEATFLSSTVAGAVVVGVMVIPFESYGRLDANPTNLPLQLFARSSSEDDRLLRG